ncbi:glycine betaine/L-proline ABC transporter ATP-binding protein [Thermaerobacter sp. PB12/4term]|uniref:quaternary amine ABC transporter ATP-binding protein n=1 Tax=Thermaerobacter sp. PB12/4term TaxID=2293838 RepID=UPI000E3264E4|nr:glycine betaine/L-proline ABC transporter ATP-binding protein [Thermaerobacter sp. PB12/4term]QIA26751.1 glycine betaine/L-proline ABC transporter ATP-binding protein [Thermaerobacter sp. PB12/4term]
MARLVVDDVYKIFGPRPREALELARAGRSKDEILKRSGHTLAVAGASLTVDAGEIFVIMGLSGSGKSTLLRCLNRLVEPTAGRILLDGQDITALGPRELLQVRRQRFAMVFQHFALLPHRTVLGNVEYGLEIRGVEPAQRRRRALEALETVGLAQWASSYPGELSGGMQQRVGLARALATDADILLMDEAFSALDPLIRREMQDELLQLQAELHRTIIFITHDLSEALKLGDRIAIMRDGRIVQVDTPEGILARPADDYVASFTEDVDRSKVFTARNVMRRPETVRETDGPRVALRKMEELQLSSVFVVDRERRLRGLVTADDALAAARRGDRTLAGVVRPEVPTCQPDTTLHELIPTIARSPWPVAVTDDRGRLVGLVARVQVLAGMAGHVRVEDRGTGDGAAPGGAPEDPGRPVPAPGPAAAAGQNRTGPPDAEAAVEGGELSVAGDG